MTINDSQLLRILAIGHDTSMRGEGISLKDAVYQADYKKLRANLTSSDLLKLIKKYPIFIEQWLLFSEDKRTSYGWYILRTNEIGQVSIPESIVRFDSIEEAVAEYIIREIDSWLALDSQWN